MKYVHLVIGFTLFFGNVFAQTFTDPNFTAIPISSGWNAPVGAKFTPDAQKLFVWEKGGRLYVCNRDGSGNYIKQAQPVADISEEVADWDAHGLVGFTIDPNFANNGLIYLLYVVDRHHLLNYGTGSYNPNVTIVGEATIGRVTRYQTMMSGSNLVINPSTRFVLIGESKTTGMPILHHSHGVGTLAFAADGTLLVTIGDAASYEGTDAGSEEGTFFQAALNDGIIRPAENVGAFRAQMINSMSGKLLRIDPQTGNGVPSNPFYSASQPRAPRSRVWALGIRNSFRIYIKPGTGSTNPAAGDIGEVYLGDVGFASWEEMNICKEPGTNFGWPIYEGNEYTIALDGVGPTYKDLNVANQDEPNPLYGNGGCNKQYFTFNQLLRQANINDDKTIYNPCDGDAIVGSGNRYYHQRPALEWSHAHPWARVGIFNGSTPSVALIGSPESQVTGTPFSGQCSVGGTLYTGNTFPAQYNNTYFQADFASGWIKRITLDNSDVIARVDNFASGYTEIVCITQHPFDGSIVTVQLNSSTGVKRVQYGGNQPPVSKPTSNVTFGGSPLTVNFNGGNSYDPSPGGSIVAYSWNFGGGSPATSNVANPGNIVFTESSGNPRKFVVRLTVTDNEGSTHTDSVIISVNNTPPVVNITSPIKNSLYTPGPDTLYACTATVSDAQHSGSQLKYEWQTILRHNDHEHRDPIVEAVNTNTLIQRVGFIGTDTYYWLIELTVTDAAGLSTKDSTKIFPDRAPSILAITPSNGATGVVPGTNISATFNEAILPSSVTGTTFQLRDAANNIIPAAISVSGDQIVLDPSSNLAFSTVFTVTIKGGADGVKDLEGISLANDFTWSFTTAPDSDPPIVTSVSPVNGATGVLTGTSITANFNEAINASTATNNTVQLRDAGSNLVSATISTSGGQVTLTPLSALTGSMVYTATIFGGASGIKDLAGNALVNNYTWSFTTAAVDLIPPVVNSALPADGATGVSTFPAISASFSEAVNPSTVSGATVQLKDAGNNIVAATINVSGTEVILTPLASLSPFTFYTTTINGGAAGVKDLAGNALAANYSWSFTTGAFTPQPVIIQSFSTKSGTQATVHTLTGVPAGALLVLATTADAVPSDCNVSSSPSLTWTKRVDAGAASSDNAEIWTAVYPAGGSVTVNSNWGTDNSQSSVCYVVLNAEPTLGGASGTAVLQSAPSVTITTTRANSIIFGCTADWKAVDGATRVLRDDATERLYFRDGHYTTYHYTKVATVVAAYTEGVSLPTGQQASTAILEIRNNSMTAGNSPSVTTQPASQSKCAGATASFTSAAEGTPAPTVQWQVSSNGTTWTDIAEATGATLSFSATNADNNKQYRAVWTNSEGSVYSNTAVLTVNAIPSAPGVDVVNNCGNSVLTASVAPGSLLWSNGASTQSITVVTAGTYTVTQTVNGCTSTAGNGVAAPKTTPILSGNETATATSGTPFTYNAASVIAGTTFAWSRATVTGISNSATSGAGDINETLVNTTSSPVNVTYIYTLTANGCTNTQNVVVTVNPANTGNNCLINTSITTNFNNTAIPAGRYIWFNSSLDPGPLGVGTDPVTVSVTNGVISFTANNVQYSLNVPNARIRFDASVTSASTQYINNVWETVVPRAYTSDVFMTGLSYLVPVNFPGNYMNVNWTANISIDKPGISVAWRWAAAAYTTFADHSGINVKPINGSTQNPYANSDRASTPENFKSFVVDGARGTGGTNYTGSFSTAYTATCAGGTIPASPTVTVVNNCGNSVLTAGSYTGSLLWSNGATTSSITVTTPGTYTVTQTVNGTSSAAASGTAAPKIVPQLLGSLAITASSNAVFTYNAASTVAGTSFVWSRAAVTGISNAAGNGTGNISETLVNTTSSPISVTYVYTLTANGCTSSQNLVVTVNPVTSNCVINNSSLTSNFNATPIPAGRYIWFNSSFDPGPLGTGTDPVTMYITNGVISFTANNVQYNLNVPNARIRFDNTVTSASTQFINNVWETVVPRSYTSDVFMAGLSFPVPVNFPGNYMNVNWTAQISIDKPGLSLGWRWAAATYTAFADHPGINVKPINGSTQNPYSNSDRANTPENFKSFVVDGAKGTGGTNYTGSFTAVNSVTCPGTGQRVSQQPVVVRIPTLPVEEPLNRKLDVTVFPNPSSSHFALTIQGDSKNPVIIKVTDISGRVVEQHEKVGAATILKIGRKLSAGTYFVEAIQGDQRKFIKIIKAN